MTDRTRTLTVLLDREYREDDVEFIKNAILAIRGVIGVKHFVSDYQELSAIETAKYELRNKIFEVLK